MKQWQWDWMGFVLGIHVAWPWRFASVGFYAALLPDQFHHFHVALGFVSVDLWHDRRNIR